MYELGRDTVLLKRWFFRDPYNPVEASDLARSLWLKLALFYAGGLALVWILAKEPAGRWALVVLSGAAIPLLFFAIFMFEPGSAERYLPAFPFLFLSMAVALASGRTRRWSVLVLTALLVSSVLFNLHAFAAGNDVRLNAVRDRKRLLEASMSAPGLVCVLTLRDDLYSLPITRPLDHSLASRKYSTIDIIETGSTRVLSWRSEFAESVLNRWARSHEVWFSELALADRPGSSSDWVEGDDKRIRWAELPDFFRKLESDAQVGRGRNGFLRVVPSAANRAFLASVAREGRFSARGVNTP
jgi:hypothetical protein